MKDFLQKSYVRDALTIVILLVLYNMLFIFSEHFFEYVNIYKVAWIFIGGFLAFIPMYLIFWVTLRKIKSQFWFFFISVAFWAAYPIIFDALFISSNSTLNYYVAGKAIRLDGNMTLHGYFHHLQTPFLLMSLYASFVFLVHLYQKLQGFKTGE